jgi:hypothetical protein
LIFHLRRLLFTIKVRGCLNHLIDLRSRTLLEMTKPGLIKCEEGLSAEARVLTLDRNRGKLATYTFAFHSLFVWQFLFGVGVVVFGLYRWTR